MARLGSTHPELFANPTLGEAVPNVFLDEEVLQAKEDWQARLGGGTPRIARRKVRYPVYMPSGTVPSNIKDEIRLVDPVDLMSSTDFEG